MLPYLNASLEPKGGKDRSSQSQHVATGLSMWPLTTYSKVWTSAPKVSTILPYLLVQELPGILFNVALVQVCCQAHEANFRKAKVSKLDVPHGCNQEAGKSETQKYGVISWFSKSADFSTCQIFPLRLL